MELQCKDIYNLEIFVVCVFCEVWYGGICGVFLLLQLMELSCYMKCCKVIGGLEVIGQGEQLNVYLNIFSGVVKLLKMMVDGCQQIVGFQFVFDFMGWFFLCESQVVVEVVVDIEVCFMFKQIIDCMIVDMLELEYKIYEQMLKELDEVCDWMLMFGCKIVQEKVVSFLYMIVMYIDLENVDKCSFDLLFICVDIVDFLGLMIEMVSCQMMKLCCDGIICIENNCYVICFDMERLCCVVGND